MGTEATGLVLARLETTVVAHRLEITQENVVILAHIVEQVIDLGVKAVPFMEETKTGGAKETETERWSGDVVCVRMKGAGMRIH